MKRFHVIFLVLVLTLIVGAGIWFLIKKQAVPMSTALPSMCAESAFEDVGYIVCTVDPGKARISLHLRDASGKPWRQLDRFTAAMQEAGQPVAFAMNAGMYHEDLSPVGLHIENSLEVAPLQIGTGEGNFYMQPNGVFAVVPDGKPIIMMTEIFGESDLAPEFATQSGPMLVIDGALNAQFQPDGASRYTRNGVGIDGKGRAVFAISRVPVSFGSFARLFRDRLRCRNALYFDGVVSTFSNGESTIEGGGYPAGPIVSVSTQ